MRRIDLQSLLELLDDDRDLLHELIEHGLIEANAESFGPDEVETILISRTLVRELEVNLPGVDVILRLRKELLLTRLHLAALSRKS